MKTKEIKLTVEEWIKIDDNPQQRNTEKRALKALKYHLKELTETHLRVAAAELPNGKRYKLDGHTRSHLWEIKKLERPKAKLKCDLYYCADIKDVVDLYEHFDNPLAVETASDKLAGAFRYFKIPKTSQLWTTGGVSTALKSIYTQKHRGMWRVDIKKTIEPFIKELRWIDTCDFRHADFPAPVFCALLMTVHKDGNAALGFWEAYTTDAGRKTVKKMDAVFDCTQRIREFRTEKVFTRGSRRAVVDCVPTLLAIYEKWEKDLYPISQRGKPEGDFRHYVLKYCGDMLKKLDWQKNENEEQLELIKA